MATKVLTYDGLSHFWAKLKEKFAPISHTHTKSQITDFPGNATTTTAGLMSATDKTNLNNLVSTNPQANVIETVKVNGTTLTVTSKAVDVPVPISIIDVDATTDTSGYKWTNASVSTQIATALNAGRLPVLHIKVGNSLVCSVTMSPTDTAGQYVGFASSSDGDDVFKVICTPNSGGTVSSVSYAPKNHSSTATTYGTGTAHLYGHLKLSDTTSGTASTNDGTAATPKAVADALQAAKTYADGKVTGAVTFQGVINSNTAIENSSYKEGWYWIVGTAGTYVGETCEVGDTIYCKTAKGTGSYNASHFNVLQSNTVAITNTEIDNIVNDSAS